MGGRQRESEGKRDRAAVSGVWDEVLTPKSGRGTELCCGQWSPGGRGAEGGGGGRGEPRAALWMWERAECRGTKTYQECRVDLFFSLSPPPPLGLEHLFCKSCSFQPVFIASPVSFTEQWPQAPPEEGESAVPSAAMVPRLLGLCCPISGFYSAHHREFGVSWRSFCSPPSDKAHLKWSAGALLYAKSKLRW